MRSSPTQISVDAMKRDAKLCREILLHVETNDNLHFRIAKYDARTVAGHVRLLVSEGLLAGVVAHVCANGNIVLEDCHVHLTREGHDFLNAARSLSATLAELMKNPWLVALGRLIGFLAAVATIVGLVIAICGWL
jgi:hypothetical protein